MSDQMIYKVLRADEWREFEGCQDYAGSSDDIRDGFIHFSTAKQLSQTLAKYFSGQIGLKLIGCRANDFGNDLKWEVSRDGDSFPHLYQKFLRSAAAEVWDLELGPDGHVLPQEVLEGEV